jgi:hypothetical protein
MVNRNTWKKFEQRWQDDFEGNFVVKIGEKKVGKYLAFTILICYTVKDVDKIQKVFDKNWKTW